MKLPQGKTLNKRMEKYTACKQTKRRLCSCISDEVDLEGKALETKGDIFIIKGSTLNKYVPNHTPSKYIRQKMATTEELDESTIMLSNYTTHFPVTE